MGEDEWWDRPRHGDLSDATPDNATPDNATPDHEPPDSEPPTRRTLRRAPMPARRSGPPARRTGRLPTSSRPRLPVVPHPEQAPDPDPPPRPPPPDGEATTGPTEVFEEAAPPPPRPRKPPTPKAKRKRRQPSGRQIAEIVGYAALGLVSLLVLSLTAYAWGQYTTLDSGIHKSNAIAAVGEKKSLNGDTNILIMGLDSRLDENGNPLPADIYDALHAGDEADGGYNANVLMLLHVPAHGRAVEISIPRDDYVDLPGCPDKVCKEKIKQAYGLARDQAYNQLRGEGMIGPALEQDARDAGRKAEVDTVSQFLGGVPIDHFVEVTLVAFFQIAQVVQPITVCVQKATRDTFSGAGFPAGVQQLDAAQALAFVRQRRDNVKGDFYYNDFTDLDRERRQQAFISSLAFQLKQAGTFTSPSKMSAILTVAKENTAIDSGLNLLTFAQEATNLTGDDITFNTLPVDHFQDLGGTIGDVNIVNLAVIHAEVRQLLNPPSTAQTSAPPHRTTTPPPTTAVTTTPPPHQPAGIVDVMNRSGQNGVAGDLENALVAKGFTQGATGTENPTARTTIVEYGSTGAEAAARAIAQLLHGVTVQRSATVSVGHVRVLVGRDFSMPAALTPAAGTTTNPTPATPTTTVTLPPPNSVTAPGPLAGGSIPCVK
ncbi:MAG TPA: LCP family protein [Pseudonocardiaceae bacterium]|nr:LCP family protein [Pseudonocardiaceae bacterium]